MLFMSATELLSEYKQRIGEVLRTQEYCDASSAEDRQRIVNALTCPLQKIELFQYRGCSQACVAGLSQGSILFKVPMKFNDPFDSMMCWRKDLVDRYFDDEKYGSVLAKLCLWDAECVALSLSNCFRVSCFSEIYSSPIMWAHYADDCRGFCVGYEMHPVFAEIIDIGAGRESKRCEESIFPVIYSNRRVDATQAMIREIEYVVAVERGALGEVDLAHYDQLESYKVSLFKSKDWAYEREWRVVLRGFDGTDRCDWLLPSENITRVIFGPKMSAIEMMNINKALHEYAAFVQRPIKTQKIIINWQDDKYEFDIEDCGEVPVPGRW